MNFISETILLGFKAGAALTIAMTQLPKLFGVTGGGDDFFERIVVLARQLPDTNLAVLAFGRSRWRCCSWERSSSPAVQWRSWWWPLRSS